MNVNIPTTAIEHFWEEPPADATEFWSFRFPPPCKVGDPLMFKYFGKPVASAVVSKIEEPGRSTCEATGRFGRGWKVFWTQESFKDLRTEKDGVTNA